MISAAGCAVLQQDAAKHASNSLLATLLIVLPVMTCVLNANWELAMSLMGKNRLHKNYLCIIIDMQQHDAELTCLKIF